MRSRHKQYPVLVKLSAGFPGFLVCCTILKVALFLVITEMATTGAISTAGGSGVWWMQNTCATDSSINGTWVSSCSVPFYCVKKLTLQKLDLVTQVFFAS